MTNIKTAVSIERELFKKAEEAAARMNISRSSFFQMALENYIGYLENLNIFNKLNNVYSDKVSEQQKDTQQIMKSYHTRHLEDTW